jgi:5-methyltetrahydrofolate--homocysteine methyltransferase
MSGLLVKSTVIMKEDLITLNERGLEPPVILGGAALNRRYVEEDLRNLYRGHVYYGEDAFAGLRIMDELAAKKRIAGVGSAALRGVVQSANRKAAYRFDDEDRDDTPLEHDAPFVSFERSPTLPKAPDRPTPPFLGMKARRDFDVAAVFKYLNERTLFSTQWQFRKAGLKPTEYEKQMRENAEPALARLKKLCLDEGILQPSSTYGFFPAAAHGNSVIVFDMDHRTALQKFEFPRQTFADRLCLADYLEPAEDGRAVDYVAFMAVTAGPRVSEVTKRLYDANQYTDYLYLHGLGVEFAEALAEHFHQQLRREWGIDGADSPRIDKLFKGHYRGRRYAFGYPACPNLEDQTGLFRLIDPPQVGITLTEQFLLEPEQSTTAIVFHHPQAKYFTVNHGEGPCVAE